MSTSPKIRFWLPLALAILGGLPSAGISAEEPQAEPGGKPAEAWNFDVLAEKAKEVAGRPYQPSPPLPEALRKLDYDGYRMIAFEHVEAIWKGTPTPFMLECFHRGYLYADKVSLNLVEEGRPQPLPYARKMFQYRGNVANLEAPADVGFAGVRMLGKFETSPHPLELASFLGASYFRAIGQGQFYGTSARGLAIDVGMPKAEEFPVFREFWIERPAPEAKEMRIWALLDSPTVAGAYRFDLKPGVSTTLAVKARLFFRRIPDKVGLAPMTSMWMWGDGRAGPAKDPRPKVHDADGLLVHTADDEWIWRPLVRMTYPSLSRYDLEGVKGFGLLQRDRRLESFRDDEAKYHLRPSVWIEPKGAWSDGAVELLELPAEHEGIDNVAAWWKPNKPPVVGKAYDVEYLLAFTSVEPQTRLGRAVATRVVRKAGRPLSIEVDFAGPALARLPADTMFDCELEVQRGEAGEPECEKRPNGTWRVRFEVRPAGAEPVELRARLAKDRSPFTETWRYLCPS